MASCGDLPHRALRIGTRVACTQLTGQLHWRGTFDKPRCTSKNTAAIPREFAKVTSKSTPRIETYAQETTDVFLASALVDRPTIPKSMLLRSSN
jgi:hypothetical protein